VSGTDLTGGGAPLGVLLQLLVALLGPVVVFLGPIVALLGLLQETLKGGVRSSFGELTHVALPYPLELARGTVQLGFALLEDTQGVLSVCVL
jgi:hypothetical protein